MRALIIVVAIAGLVGCGVETAGTAATAAAVKKQEIEQGKKAMEQAQQKVTEAVQTIEQRTEQAHAEEK